MEPTEPSQRLASLDRSDPSREVDPGAAQAALGRRGALRHFRSARLDGVYELERKCGSTTVAMSSRREVSSRASCSMRWLRLSATSTGSLASILRRSRPTQSSLRYVAGWDAFSWLI